MNHQLDVVHNLAVRCDALNIQHKNFVIARREFRFQPFRLPRENSCWPWFSRSLPLASRGTSRHGHDAPYPSREAAPPRIFVDLHRDRSERQRRVRFRKIAPPSGLMPALESRREKHDEPNGSS